MTPTQFTAWATAVFGAYPPAMKLEVEKWLADKSIYFIAALRVVALAEHPSVYGRPPGVHELEVMKVQAYREGHALEAKQIESDGGQKQLPGGEVIDFEGARKQLGWGE